VTFLFQSVRISLLWIAGPGSLVESVVIADAGTAGKSNRASVREVLTIARYISRNCNHVALLQGVSRPPMLHQRIWTAQLKFPSGGLTARFNDIQEEAGMWIQPFDLRHSPFEIPLLGEIEYRAEGMMRP
jgi:hypothetical protein